MIALAVNHDNTIVIALKTVIVKDLRPYHFFGFLPQPYLQKYKPYIKYNQITRV